MKRTPSQVVFTCHGINSNGSWQDDVDAVLSPFFIHKKIRYRAFRFFGVTKLLLGPWAIIVGIAGLSIAVYLRLGWLVYLGISFVGFLGAWIEPPIRRFAAYLFVRKHIERTSPVSDVHVIAHSFGTWLITKILERNDHAKYGHVVLVGGVIREDYNWKPYLPGPKRRGRLKALRNEFGAEDDVVGFSAWVAHRVPGFGLSGFGGFQVQDEKEDLIHFQEGIWECPKCTDGKLAPIHNVELRYRHSEALSVQHARESWLPFLWGFIPAEFSDFVRVCTAIKRAEGEQNLSAADKGREELRSAVWIWTGGKRFDTYVGGELRRLNERRKGPSFSRKQLNSLTQRALDIVWTLVAEADVELQREPMHERNVDVINYLFPRWAVGAAVQGVLQSERENRDG